MLGRPCFFHQGCLVVPGGRPAFEIAFFDIAFFAIAFFAIAFFAIAFFGVVFFGVVFFAPAVFAVVVLAGMAEVPQLALRTAGEPLTSDS